MAERSSAIFWVLCPKQSLHCYTRFLTYLEQAEHAQRERDRAETEKIAKEQALDAIAKFTAKLREMGVDPENL
ncbi:MAG: hypothetical protein IM585_02165 [Pseudanabaena sp. M135S2SP2A07QC]|nr:hypothetical protein [Pseudanabaena sp. M090S1SP2A07QC]MCA6507630.1 hypothetical protein [Pseudanabaena sp. M172S2SP2A07QC]MCA6520666.1 hypothetical protein [Pseudanabaena sp. M051S1SP2A07QC]MCA6526613.1 hypothetical protein [Pseudanabaena sp. M179S2SP2A07QC]MCA6529892.1 hypothetical protein [Pseudanabaena sp. M125S2SP2A07QC]MCA6532679.1 hypothetical protein [Pseudanabaena sp. M176S2SP2A07QC]MCA6539879.1 hypothetical protein [Pseudanabaena sp. M037S2SP2A07QC]MCA6545336.1 hypothetical prot